MNIVFLNNLHVCIIRLSREQLSYMRRVDRDVEKQTMNIFVKNPCASQISKDAQ